MAGRKTGRKGASKKKSGSIRRVRGRGDYSVSRPGRDNRDGVFAKLDRALRTIPRGTFATKGAQTGRRFGGGVGAAVGRLAGRGMAAISGYGNYSVNSNSLSKVSTSMDMVPQFVKNEHSVRVKHREFIKDIVVPGDGSLFDLQDFVINPGNRDLFPWLGQMARQYSQYKIHGMVFAYKTMSSDYAASGPLGTVMMATNYNAIDRVFANKIELENTEFAVSTKPSMSLVHAIECDPKVSGFDVLYIRDPAYETGEVSDRRFYDYGRFQVATAGLPGAAASTLGELWVSYDIELMKPIIGGIYTTGVTVVSGPTGLSKVAANAGMQTIRYLGVGIPPVVSTVYNPMPPSYTVQGDTGINGPVVTLVANVLTLRKNGYYQLLVGGQSSVTGSLFTFGSVNLATNSISITTGKVGKAWYNALTPEDDPSDPEFAGENTIPHAYAAIASTAGGTYKLMWEFYVSGIETAADYLTVNLSNFTTTPSGIVPNWQRFADVKWLATGTNDQVETFVASPNGLP